MSDTEAKPRNGFFKKLRFQLTNWQILLIALIIIGGRLVIDFSQRIIDGQEKTSEQAMLEAEIARLELEQRQLEAAKAYYSSPAYIEEWAHDEGKMVRQGEILVVPSFDTSVASVETLPARPDEIYITLENWQVWWSLFFDDTSALEHVTP